MQRIRFVSLFVCTLRSTGSIRIRNEWKSEQKAEVLLMQRKEGGGSFLKSLSGQERSYCKLKRHLGGEPVVMSHQGVWDSSHRPWQHSFMTGM